MSVQIIRTVLTVAMMTLVGFLLAPSSEGLSNSSSGIGQSEDLGTLGKTYSITESDILELIQKRLKEAEKSGEIAAMNKELLKQGKESVRRPKGSAYPKAMKVSKRRFDPAITLMSDIQNEKGQVIFKAGTKVNPLDFMPFRKTLCFIDGDDPAQVTWASFACGDRALSKIILVHGSPVEVAKTTKRRIYFDQEAQLTKRFGISAMPAKIEQEGQDIYVTELPIN